MGALVALLVAVLLAAAVTWERLAIGPLGPDNLAVWLSGLVVVGCVVTGRWFSLTRRAAVAAAVSWLTTLGVIIFGPIEHSWGLGESLALGILMAWVIRTLPARPAVLLGVALGTAAIIAPARDEHPGPITTVMGVLTLCLAAAFTYIRVLDTQRTADITAARTRERLEFARELHDLVAQHITGILLLLPRVRVKPALLDDIETAGQQAMAAMRRLVALLRDDAAPPLDSGIDLGAINTDADILRRKGLRVTVEVDESLRASLPKQTAIGVYRIIRESLTNVGKHAHDATQITVTVVRGSDGLTVEVTDDGQPTPTLDPKTGGGFGLLGLRERLEELGGTLESGPVTPKGWRVKAQIPPAG